MKGKVTLQILIATCLLSLNAIGANEVSQQISGPNGYCLDVQKANYTDGNPVIVWTCATNPGANQLWSFQTDGTLRSNGKCLTATGSRQRATVVINNCDTAAKNATLWQPLAHGEIVNPPTGLILAALYATSGTQLTLQRNIFSSFQKWRVGNDTSPDLATIVGMQGLCLQLENNLVWVDQCESDHLGQRWLFYQDGTIRPQQYTNGCLGFDNLPNRQIIVFTCGHGGASQRWLYTRNSTILNERLSLVFDVTESDPSRKKIIVYPPTGKPNQSWNVTYHSKSSM